MLSGLFTPYGFPAAAGDKRSYSEFRRGLPQICKSHGVLHTGDLQIMVETRKCSEWVQAALEKYILRNGPDVALQAKALLPVILPSHACTQFQVCTRD